jgi:Cu/Ag efflux pump CusA
VDAGDVASVHYGPEIRRGAADWNGTGEAVGGIVVMRIGSNALQVIQALETEIATLRLPDGVRTSTAAQALDVEGRREPDAWRRRASISATPTPT